MNRLAKERKAAGLTQSVLADHLGVTVMAVAHWENGRRSPSVARLRAIAKLLGVRIGRLIDDP